MKEAMNLIETLVVNHYSIPIEKKLMKSGVMEIDTLNAFLAQN